MSKNAPVRVEERYTQITHGTNRFHVRLIGKELQQPIWKMNESPLVDHLLAGRAHNADLIIRYPLTVQPERKSAKTALFGKVFRHPSAVRPQDFSQVLDQSCKKLLAGLRCGAFEDCAQGDVGLKILERRGMTR